MPTKSREKHIGQVFTPDFIVSEMLDYANYKVDSDILDKHIIDNSCGDGAFLIQIVRTYIQTAINSNRSASDIVEGLETYVHGIDNDEIAIANCLANLNALSSEYGLSGIKWDVRHNNTLKVSDYDGMMDFVVGNLPYVRVHNLDDAYSDVKQYKFADGGMTDLYLVFFEIGFNMLNERGTMCYITPSSWLNSVAAKQMRSYIVEHANLVSLVDLGHYQPFGGITTYTMISLFSKQVQSDEFDYYIFNGRKRTRNFVDRLSYNDVLIDACFYLADRSSLKEMKEIKNSGSRKYVCVKNGFATLADKSFIGNDIPDTFITIPVIKGSTGKWSKCLFPYDINGKPLAWQTISADSVLRAHFEREKEHLLKGKPEYEGWHLFGRTQAIRDVWKYKIAINSLLRTKADLKISEVLPGQGIYSGLYIIGDIDLATVRTLLVSDEFVDYIKCIKKYKSGGYYTFNSKDVEQFINYKLSVINGQSRISIRAIRGQ